MADGVHDVDDGETITALPAEFGPLLRTLRLREGFSQQKLALAVFGSARKSSVGELENDPRRIPHPHTLKKLCEVLNLSDQERLLVATAVEKRRHHASLARSVRAEPSANGDEQPTSRQPESVPSSVVERAASQRDPTPTAHEPSLMAQPAARSSPQRGWVRKTATTAALAVTGVAVIGLAIITAVKTGRELSSAPDSTSTVPSAGGILVTIESPLEGQTVDSPLTMTGTAQLAEDQQLWLLVHPVIDTNYYTAVDHPIVIDASGAWAAKVRLGRGPQDEGYKFEVFAVVSPAGGAIDQANEQRPSGHYSVQLLRIPPDDAVAARVRVTLGRYTG